MSKVIILLALAVCVIAEFKEEYTNFLNKHDSAINNKLAKWKNLTKEDRLRRQENYLKNKAFIEEHNKKNLSFKLGLNEHSDRDTGRFMKERNQLKLPAQTRLLPATPQIVGPAKDSVNWISMAAPIARQGACGSCWAFATIAVLGEKLLS